MFWKLQCAKCIVLQFVVRDCDVATNQVCTDLKVAKYGVSFAKLSAISIGSMKLYDWIRQLLYKWNNHLTPIFNIPRAESCSPCLCTETCTPSGVYTTYPCLKSSRSISNQEQVGFREITTDLSLRIWRIGIFCRRWKEVSYLKWIYFF